VKKLFFLLALGLSACAHDGDMKTVQYDYLINDGNSKVWMIEKMIIDKSNIAPRKDENKELLIFFERGKFQYVPLKQLGDKTGKSGDYFLDSDEKKLKLYFKKSIWEFRLTEISENSIHLVPTENSDAEFTIRLVPLKYIL